jgi:hypothetical protein
VLQSVTDKLRSIHKEYARKPMNLFKQAVQKGNVIFSSPSSVQTLSWLLPVAAVTM